MVVALLVALALQAPSEPERGLVMPLEVPPELTVEASSRHRLESDLAGILRRYRRLNVMTQSDVKRLAALDAERQMVGCDTSCAAEIANAVGARWLFSPRIERVGVGVALSMTLVDVDTATVIGRGRGQAADLRALAPQLPFIVDDAAASLRSPGDPSPADILNEARPKLAVLPVRVQLTEAVAGADVVVNSAAVRAAERLQMLALTSADFAAMARERGCAPEDIGCSLPATTGRGVALGLGVSLQQQGAEVLVRATLLASDGRPTGRGARTVASADPSALAAGISAAVDEAVHERLGTAMSPAAGTTTKTPTTKTPTTTTTTTDRASATLIADMACNLYRGIEAVGSKCYLYSTHLEVRPHAFNFQNGVEVIEWANVTVAEPFNPAGIPSGVRLWLRDGQSRDFIFGIGGRDRALEKIQPLLSR